MILASGSYSNINLMGMGCYAGRATADSNPDSDSDILNDYIELVDEGTNPLMPDTDMNDLVESADPPRCSMVCPCPTPLSRFFHFYDVKM